MIVHSRGGLAKSFTCEKLITNGITFSGHSTPLSIYLQAHKNPNAKLIFDDVDTLLSNKTCVALLKQLAETKVNKKVRYGTTHKVNEEKVPESFVSNNKVLILCNDIKKLSKNMKALLTRGILLNFTPTNESIYEELTKFAEDKEILSHLKANLNKIADFNMRVYIKCNELKKAKIYWQKYLESEYVGFVEDELVREIAEMPKNQRDSIWKARTGKGIRCLQKKIKLLNSN